MKFIKVTDLSDNVGIEIDDLDEYLAELKKRGFITYENAGVYINLKGRMAIENAKKQNPFQEEIQDKKIKKYWSITKITAGVLNALAIIGIAFWAQISSNKNSDLLNEINNLKAKLKIEKIEQSKQIDSIKLVLNKIQDSIH